MTLTPEQLDEIEARANQDGFLRQYSTIPHTGLLALVREARNAARYREALNKIASWEEGPDVTAAFDDPGSAAWARQALQEEPK